MYYISWCAGISGRFCASPRLPELPLSCPDCQLPLSCRLLASLLLPSPITPSLSLPYTFAICTYLMYKNVQDYQSSSNFLPRLPKQHLSCLFLALTSLLRLPLPDNPYHSILLNSLQELELLLNQLLQTPQSRLACLPLWQLQSLLANLVDHTSADKIHRIIMNHHHHHRCALWFSSRFMSTHQEVPLALTAQPVASDWFNPQKPKRQN